MPAKAHHGVHQQPKEIHMTTLTPFQATWQPRALAALRIVAGYLFIFHGTAKLFHVPHVEMFDNLQLFSLLGAAGIIELVGGAALIVGLFTRPAAFILSGFSAFAYFIGHAPKGNVLLPMLNGGELAAMSAFLFLFIAVAGGGAWALDNLRRGKGSDAASTSPAFGAR